MNGMDTFKFTVTMTVETDAFDPIDAAEAVRESFGLGEMCGVEIVETEVVGPIA